MDNQSIAALCIALLAILSPFVLFFSKSWVREDIVRTFRNRKRRTGRGTR